MAVREYQSAPEGSELWALRQENRTLYGVIKLVSSSLELVPMLQGVVDLATEATDCHACFIYLLEDDELIMRAASPVFGEAVDRVRFSVQEGLTGWVARHRTPEFIRDQAMRDPRMKYVPLLQEERFQSMAAVPILARAGETIGVIVLHTEAPREFAEDTLKLMVHIASLVSGAIENAQLYARERQTVDTLTGVSELAQQIAGAVDVTGLASILVEGTHRLLRAEVCQLLRLDADGDGLSLLASVPAGLPRPATRTADGLIMAALEGRGGRVPPQLWESTTTSDLLVTPLSVGDERVGLLCAGAPAGRVFGAKETEVARAIAHLGAVAIRRAELIEGLTNANIVKDLFQALAADATALAVAKAVEIGCDLSAPYLMAVARAGRRPASPARESGGRRRQRSASASANWRRARRSSPGRDRCERCWPTGPRVPRDWRGCCASAASWASAAARSSESATRATCRRDAARAYREAKDASQIAHALLGDGGAIAYSQVGAYRYLVQIDAADAPRDRMRAAVDRLIAYDAKRRTALLDTLERYLSERRSVIESARALYIHPNTLRQRLGRIEELTGIDLDTDDLLSLELAIKLARLHGRPEVAG